MREEKFHIYLNDDEYSRLIMGHFFGTYFDIFKHLSCVILTNPTTSSIIINDILPNCISSSGILYEKQYERHCLFVDFIEMAGD